jgi:hypothetical protein
MILRRLAKAMTEQKWLTVVVELVIVVLGIFIGLRVTEWSDDRKLERQEAVYLGILHNDVEAMQGNVRSRMARREALAATMRAALTGLESCDASADTRAALEETFESYQSGPGIGIIDATYNEMVSSGSLARIGNQDLKRAIATTFSELNTLNARLNSFRVSMPVVDRIVWKRVAYSIDTAGVIKVRFDVPAMCDDSELRNAVVEMIDIQHDGVTTFNRALEKLDGLLSALDTHGAAAPLRP